MGGLEDREVGSRNAEGGKERRWEVRKVRRWEGWKIVKSEVGMRKAERKEGGKLGR